MAISGTVSIVTAANLAAVQTACQAVKQELINDFGTCVDFTLAQLQTWITPPYTSVKFMDSTNTLRGADVFVQLPNNDVESILTVTDKSLVLADRIIVARRMIGAGANRMVALGMGDQRLIGRCRAGGNMDAFLDSFGLFDKMMSGDGRFATYSAPATVCAGAF